tara:strand:- start:1998 stop:2504 length:507 start_codon:yes stop_codon:yes gene_type:complete
MPIQEKATGNLSIKILPDELRKRLKGSISYTPADVNDKWVYSKVTVNNVSSDILSTDDDYLMVPATSVAVGDKCKFITLRHTGFTDANETTPTNLGIVIVTDADTAAYTSADGIFLAPGDTVALKLPNTPIGSMHAVSVRISAGVPTAATSSGDDILLEVTAILDDIG